MRGLARKVGDITQTGVDTGDATAHEEDVLEGTTVYLADGARHDGTMVDMTVDDEHAGTPSLKDGNLRIKIPVVGKYGLNNYIKSSFSVIRNLIDLTAEKIAIGNTILGLAGTCAPYMQSVGSGYLCPSDGYIGYCYYHKVTNHDNSGEHTAYASVYVNGKAVNSQSCHVSAWGGGSMNLTGIVEVKKGDTVSYGFSWSSDESISWEHYWGAYFGGHK